MGTALIAGIIAAGQLTADQIVVVELVASRREDLATTLPGVHTTDVVQPAVNTLIATKPDIVTQVAADAARVGTQRILSVAAGISTEAIARAANSPQTTVLRCMPNTPALLGHGAIGLSGATNATRDDLDWAARLLGAVGLVVEVDESQLDAVTGLSGSGPAYFFRMVEALIQGGIEAGLSPEDAQALTIQTMHGAAQLLQQPNADPAALRVAVTSPNGTTAAGLRTLEEHGLEEALIAAVAAATKRAEELGR